MKKLGTKNVSWKKRIDKIKEKVTADYSECLSRKQRVFYGIASVVFVIAFFIFSISSYILNTFNNLTFEELIFHLKVPMKGTGNSMIMGYFTYAKKSIILFGFFYMAIIFIFRTYKKLRNKNAINWLAFLLSIVCLVGSVARIGTCLNVVQYMKAQTTYSNISLHMKAVSRSIIIILRNWNY